MPSKPKDKDLPVDAARLVKRHKPTAAHMRDALTYLTGVAAEAGMTDIAIKLREVIKDLEREIEAGPH